MNTQLIEYLYGEMPDADKEAFEAKLANDPELQKELNGLQDLREMIQIEREVIIPNQVFQVPKRKAGLHPVVINILAVAAGFALLMIVGGMSRLQLHKSNGQFVISFGQAQLNNDAVENFQPISQHLVEAQLSSLKNDMEMLINQKMQPAPVNESPHIQPVLSDFKNELTTSQREWTRNLINQYQQNQDANVEKLIDELLNYWDSQRQIDLQYVNRGFDQILQSIESRPDPYQELLLNAKNENY